MERAQRRKYHFIYKTTCIITNNFYIGMHSTDNLEDGYIGSGKRLWYSINKHGKDNHVCEIIEFLPDRKSLKEREQEIVNKELLNEQLCMNIQIGGGGGFSSEEHKRKAQDSGRKSYIERLKNDKDFLKKMTEILTKQNKGNCFGIGNKAFSNKSHSEETKRKIGESNSVKQKGSKNSQYGKCWITNETESKKINKGDIIPEGWRLGRKIK
jgi:hypothetical protein